MMKKFQKKVENFTCEHCGTPITGTGYTNHCPNCLYSKHVDINPGDRAETCGGLMKPVGLETKRGEIRIIHQCLKCGTKRLCTTSSTDNLVSPLV